MQQPLSKSARARIVRLYRNGCTTREIAETLGHGTKTIRKYVKAAGCMRPATRHHVKLPSTPEIREMVGRLGSRAAVAEVFGVSRQAVSNRLRAAEGA